MSGGRPDAWQAVLGRGLGEQVQHLDESPLSLDDVRGRARSVRRGRRLTTAAGLLAAAAVVAPAALILGPSLQRADDGLPVAPSSPSPTRADDPSDPGPGLTYLEGRILVRPDGTTVELPARYQAAAVLDGGLVGARRAGETSWVLDVLDPSGDVADTVAAGGPRLAADAAGTAVARVAPDGTVRVLTAEGDRPLARVGPEVAPLALTGDCTGSAESCRVYLSLPDDRGGATVVDATGRVERLAPAALALADATDDGRLAVMTSVDDLEPGSCHEVYDTAASATLVGTCDYTPLRFSPGGGLLTATQSYLDGIGNGFTAILDAATLQELARYEPGSGFVSDQVWIDEATVAVSTHDDASGTWRLVLLSTDGSTRVVATVPGDEMSPPFLLLEGSPTEA